VKKASQTESVILDFFKEAFQFNPYHRIRPEGIFKLFNRAKRIRIKSVQNPIENHNLRVEYRHPRSLNNHEQATRLYSEIIFLSDTINLLKKLFHDTRVVLGEIGSLEFLLIRRSQQMPEYVEYEFQCRNEMEAYRKMNILQAKMGIRNILVGRMHGLKLNPQPRREIKELMFRLLLCSMWEELMVQLRKFIQIFNGVLECEEGEEIQSLEHYARSERI